MASGIELHQAKEMAIYFANAIYLLGRVEGRDDYGLNFSGPTIHTYGREEQPGPVSVVKPTGLSYSYLGSPTSVFFCCK